MKPKPFPKTTRVSHGDIVITERNEHVDKQSTFYICLVDEVGRGGSLKSLQHISGDTVLPDTTLIRVWVYPKKKFKINPSEIAIKNEWHKTFKSKSEAEKLISV